MRTRRALLLSASLAVGCSASDSSTGSTSPDPSGPYSANRVTSIVTVDKLDLVFVLDGSTSMADKQQVLAQAIPDLLARFVSPRCLDAAGQAVGVVDASGQCGSGHVREFVPVRDIHMAVLSSSLGGHGADACAKVTSDVAYPDDRGRPVDRKVSGGTVPTYQGQGFLAWDPDGQGDPPGEGDASALLTSFGDLVKGVDQKGCGFEASLETWYRFLIDPDPPASVVLAVPGDATKGAVASGTDTTLLQQRAAFLRPDSLVAIINVSDENDCSIIDGTLPAKVCESPTLDASGDPTGECAVQLTGWPSSYARGNFQGYTEENGTIAGTPFPANNLTAQLGRPLSDPLPSVGACSDGSQEFCLAPGTDACMDDPDSSACRSCYLATDGGCSSASTLPAQQDPVSLRCWNQKQRFGVDMLYPLQRYIDGLSEQTIYDRRGFKVQNPLFDDLPYRAAQASGTTGQLGRSKAASRPSRLVFFAPIVGVPWQDIARNQGDLATGGSTPPDLLAGYLPTAPATDAADRRVIDWDRILGNPFGHGGKPRVDPKDPLMIEAVRSDDPLHPREGRTHPVTGETIGATTWNSVNGREQPGLTDRLQYACVFELPTPIAWAGPPGDAIDRPITTAGLLHERRTGVTGDGITFDDPPRQYRAGAYPGTRFLQVAKEFGAVNVPGNAIVASICTPDLTAAGSASDAADHGFRPAAAAIVDTLKTQLIGQCLPYTLPSKDGSASCVLIDARFPRTSDGSASDPTQVAACRQCAGAGRRPLDPRIAAALTGGVGDHDCLCEIEQLTGDDLHECQSRTDETLTSSEAGWCYVDPEAPDMPDPPAAAQIVARCPSTRPRLARFVGLGRVNSTLFLACRGGAGPA